MSERDRARGIIDGAVAGSLGTLSDSGGPFVSLVTLAVTGPTTMVMLLSGLAQHTKNLDQRKDCSLLLIEPGGESGDPLAGARLTLTGTARRLGRDEEADARAKFLDRHPTASMYVDFEDFAFYEITIHQGHLVAGFGRIETIAADAL